MEDKIKVFNSLKKEIEKGVPYSILKDRYPLMTKPLYKKLSGIRKIYRYDLNNEVIKILTSDGLSLGNDSDEFSKEAESYIVGSLLGDGHIEPIVDNEYTTTFLYRVTHCWSQLSYIKYIYECLKPYSSALTIKEPKKGLQDYHVQFTTITTPNLKKFRDIFYRKDLGGKKDIMSERVYSLIDYQSLAYWIMDDGKSRGGKYCFSLCIGFQGHYNDDRINRMTQYLTNKLGITFKWKKEKNNYEVYILSRDKELVKSNILRYILPDFYYKFKADPQELGEFYKSKDWYLSWQDKKLSIQHPFLDKFYYSDYKESKNESFKKRFEKSLFTRTVARGFPYIKVKEEEIPQAWKKIPLYEVSCSPSNVLSCSPKVNIFSNHFMNHRFHCKKKNNYSPYSVFLDRKKLRKTLSIQLKSGPNINNSNIRNALSTYSSSGLGVFNTGIARYLIEKYSANNNVLDPCSGWGNRLCATASLGKNYTGIEPSSETYNALLSIKEKLKGLGVLSNISIIKSVAEDSCNYRDNYYGCCITSPPYFNLEEYSSEDTQSYKRYTTYKRWCDSFLEKMISNSYWSLCAGGFFVINVGNVGDINLVGNTKDICLSLGLSFVTEYSLRPFKRPGMDFSWGEPVMVFKKG